MDKQMLRFTRRGFTLVELLVVIGIIAVLIGILLPTLNRVKQSSTAAACGSNLSQMVKGVYLYSANNKGLLPIGYAPIGITIDPVATVNGNTYTFGGSWQGWMAWFTIINNAQKGDAAAPPYVSRNGDPRAPMPRSGSSVYTSIAYKLGNSFRCAAVPTSEFPQLVHYYHNSGAFVHPVMEAKIASSTQGLVVVGPSQRKRVTPLFQRRQADLLPQTALFWDTPAMASLTPELTSPPSEFTVPTFQDPGQEAGRGELVMRASNIDSWDSPDSGRLSSPQDFGFGAAYGGVPYAALRFRYNGRDHTAALSGSARETRGLNEPILIPTDEEVQLYASFSGAGTSFNNDLGGDTLFRAQIGNVRFRHGNNDTAQVAFSDGSVQTVKLNKKRTFGDDQYYYNDFKRSYLLTKPPATAIYRAP